MVIGTSVADRNALWSPWQGPLDELECRYLESWNKTLPSSTDNGIHRQYSPFEKELLAVWTGLKFRITMIF